MEKTTSVSHDTPEDVATLYSWANLRGATYRDFSASRAQVREKARQRVLDAMETERKRAEEEAEARKSAAVSASAYPPEVSNHEAAGRELPSREAVSHIDQAVGMGADKSTFAAAAMSAAVQAGEVPGYPAAQQAAWQASQPVAQVSAPSNAYEHSASAAQSSAPAPQREGMDSRWFALKNLFAESRGVPVPAEPVLAPAAGRAPALAVFSLAGGVGKTSLVATLGRALSTYGERVLLVDTATFGTLPYFFGARDHRMGVLRTFNAPTANSGAPVEMLTLDPEGMGPESIPQEPLTQEILRNARGASRVLVDLATASGTTIRRVLRMAPSVLVPVVPDISSVSSVGAIESFFRRNSSGTGHAVTPYYVLNRFDEEQKLHQDVREILRSQVGDRLLPIALHRTSKMSEALAEGMTVMDYAPGSPVAQDYMALAGWTRSLAAPAEQVYRGARWSER